MQATTIQITEIRPPKVGQSGKLGPGHIIDAAGVDWTVWQDKLPPFLGKEGQSVTINYKSEADKFTGGLRYTILGMAGMATGLPPRPSPQSIQYAATSAPRSFASPSSPVPTPPKLAGFVPTPPLDPAKKDENIAILALAKLYEGKLALGDRQALVATLKMCRSAWRELQDGGMMPSLQEELNDEIPSFEEKSHTLDETYE